MYTLYLGLEILFMCVLSYRDVGLVWFAAMANYTHYNVV